MRKVISRGVLRNRTSQLGNSMKHTGSRVLKLLLDVFERQEPIERLEWFDDGLGLAFPGQRKTNVNAPPAQDCREVKV